jgi:hypothetical protein
MVSFLGYHGPGGICVFAAFLAVSRSSALRADEPLRVLQEESAGPLISHGRPCTPCLSTPGSDCTIKVKVNLFAGSTGTSKIGSLAGFMPWLLRLA